MLNYRNFCTRLDEKIKHTQKEKTIQRKYNTQPHKNWE